MMQPSKRCSMSLFSMYWDVCHPLFLNKVQVRFWPYLQDSDRRINIPSPTMHSISEDICPPLRGISCASPPSLNRGSSHCWDGCIHCSSPKWLTSLIFLPSPSTSCRTGLIYEVPEAYRQRKKRLDTQQEKEVYGSGRASWTVFRNRIEAPGQTSVYNFCTCCD